MRRTAHAHAQLVAIATDLCLTSYEDLMRSNAVRAEWKRRHPGASEKGLQAAFLRRYLRTHIGPARATLAGMLEGPYDEAYKESIYEVLCLDNTLVRGRDPAVEAIGNVERERAAERADS